MQKRNWILRALPMIVFGIVLTSASYAQQNKEAPKQPINGCDTCLPIVSYGSDYYFYVLGLPVPTTVPDLSGGVASLTIDPPLPTGLIFNTTTGEITGTPTVATDYVPHFIRAFDSHGRCGSTVIRVSVGATKQN